jgi:hypothetical protein
VEEYEKLLAIENQFLFLDYEPPEYLREEMDRVWRNSTSEQREEYRHMAANYNDKLDKTREPEWWSKTLQDWNEEICLVQEFFKKQQELPASLRSKAACIYCNCNKCTPKM